MKSLKYSVIIPVYNSAPIVDETIDQVVTFFEQRGWNYELIAVNDGSRDQSWEVIRNQAIANRHIIAINLLQNYGQHTALFCGFQESSGDYVITLDDDLQNPPEEMLHLIEKAGEGYDLVFGRFRQKQHALYRRLGTLLIGAINKQIFHKPDGLILSNFRIIRRDVVDRICSHRTAYPYIQGLSLMFSANPANVWVDHNPRPVGNSNYSLLKIFELVMRILFNYSSFPLRFISSIGAIIAVVSFLIGFYYLSKAIIVGFSVPGWATVVVLLSFFNGLIIFMLSMLGEYTVRLLTQFSHTENYHIKEVIGPQT